MADPTIEFVSIELGGKTYRLALDLGAIADAEDAINRRGGDVNLIRGVDFAELNTQQLLILFAYSLRIGQPDLKYEDALALARSQNMKSIAAITESVVDACLKSMGIDPAELQKKMTKGDPEISAESSTGLTSGVSDDTTQG